MDQNKKYNDIEDEDEEVEIMTPFDPKLVEIGVEQVTIDQLASRIEHSEIDMMPDFQRYGNLWDITKMSQLIESILIKLPLPAFYMDVKDDEKWVVVDGLQRLSTIDRFMVKNDLPLKNLEFLNDLEGKTFNELDRKLKRRIKETNVTIFSIKKGTPQKVLTALFHRINTGGTKLTAQEIRHALNQGVVTQFISEITLSEHFLNVLHISPKRMLDRELAIRFCAFYRGGYKAYKSTLQSFLDDEMEFLNKKTNELDKIHSDLKTKLYRSLSLSSELFVTKAFCKALIHNDKKLVINRSLFETTTVNIAYLNDNEQQILINDRSNFVEDYKELLRNIDFDNAITANTNSKANVEIRHIKMQELLTKYTGHDFKL